MPFNFTHFNDHPKNVDCLRDLQLLIFSDLKRMIFYYGNLFIKKNIFVLKSFGYKISKLNISKTIILVFFFKYSSCSFKVFNQICFTNKLYAIEKCQPFYFFQKKLFQSFYRYFLRTLLECNVCFTI